MLYVFAWVAAALYCADIVVHFIAIVKQKELMRRISKTLLMPLLAIAFILFWFSLSSAALPWLVVLAFLMGCAGDVFLFDHHDPVGFPLGLASFAVGHVLYLIKLFSIMTAPAWWVVALLAAVYLTGAAIMIKKLLPNIPKKILPAGVAYILLLCTFNVVAASAMLTAFSAGSAMLFAGTLFFLVSDSTISFDLFRGAIKNSDIKIMTTYIAAQTLIAAGFLLQIV